MMKNLEVQIKVALFCLPSRFAMSLFILLMVFLASCNSSDNDLVKKDRISASIYKEKEIGNLNAQYSIKYLIDTLSLDYSIQFDNILNKEHLMTHNFAIHDIYRFQDSAYLKINVWNRKYSYYFTLSVSEILLQRLLRVDRSSKSYSDIALIFKIDEIKRIDVDVLGYPYDQHYSTIDLERSDSFIAKGRLVEFKSLSAK